MSTSKRATIAVSIGCPAGIGPEVSVVAAAATARRARIVLAGDPDVILRAATLRGVPRSMLIDVDATSAGALARGAIGVLATSARSGLATYGKPGRRAGRAQLAWIDQALELVTSGVADAITTGPVSKHAIASAGAPAFRGHTEHLAERTGTAEVFMAFWHRDFTAALVTTHLPLAAVSRAIDAGKIERCTLALADFVTRVYPGSARVEVMGLNPHAGEAGLIGREEIDAIIPGVRAARRRLGRGHGVTIDGPIGAETVVRHAQRGTLRGFVAMYHDQATIPMKLLTFGEAVNVTLGLPIIRTSVDHGTGYDIAGSAKADASGMEQALRLAVTLASRSTASPARR